MITQSASNQLEPIGIVPNRIQFHLIGLFPSILGILADRAEYQPPPGRFRVIPFLNTVRARAIDSGRVIGSHLDHGTCWCRDRNPIIELER